LHSFKEKFREMDEDPVADLHRAISDLVDNQIDSKTLRTYFARQLVLNVYSNQATFKAREAWEQFAVDMSRDFIEEEVAEETAIRDAYLIISGVFESNTGLDIHQVYSLPSNNPIDNIEEDPPNLEAIADRMYSQLSDEQRQVVDAVVASVNNQVSQKLFFVTGKAGTGKTFLYRTLYYKVVSTFKHVICTAFTGLAASILPYGMTTHRAFDIPFSYANNRLWSPMRDELAQSTMSS
jgi:chromosomal replication initiation ATPase DnaA